MFSLPEIVNWRRLYSYENNLEEAQTCVKQPLSIKTIKCFSIKLSLNAGQKYCRMLQRKHTAILSTFIKLLVVIKAICIFEWPFTQVLLYCQFSHPADCLTRLVAMYTDLPCHSL